MLALAGRAGPVPARSASGRSDGGREGSGGMASTVATWTARDGTALLTRHWDAPDPWARLLLVHGIAEHSGRYERVGGTMAGEGIDVHALDLRGFGGSAGRRAYVGRWDE
jgi:alpha-beta hydrolase superfamily lysophospholipase